MMQIIKNKSNDIYIDSIILKLSPKITSIPINHQTRFQGQSTYSFSKLISLWLNMAKDSAARPFRFFSFFILILKLILLFKKKIKDIEQFKIIEKTF
mgnify:FL=1